jgi:DNA-binding transcriptional MocR family regulator
MRPEFLKLGILHNRDMVTAMISPYAFRPRGRLLDFMRQVGNPELINLAAGLPSVECVPKAALEQAFAETLRDNADEALGYHTPDGDLRLREILVERLQRRGILTSVDKMVLTTGCTQALHGMIRLLARPGDVVACEAPAYYATLEILGDLGVRVLPIPVRDSEGIDLDLVRALFRRFRPTLFVICSTLSNPSGSTLSNEARIELVQICRESSTRILEDEIYGELSEIPNLKPIRAYDDGSTVAYVTSFSKSVAPGLRIGVCLPGIDSDSFALVKCQQDMHSATLCEVAFRNYLERGELDRHLEFLRAFNRKRRELGIRVIHEYFPQSTRVWEPAGGFMLWVELPTGVDIDRIYQQAMEVKVAFCRGAVFFTSENEHVGAMRLNCSRPDEAALVKGLKILGQIMS